MGLVICGVAPGGSFIGPFSQTLGSRVKGGGGSRVVCKVVASVGVGIRRFACFRGCEFPLDFCRTLEPCEVPADHIVGAG